MKKTITSSIDMEYYSLMEIECERRNICISEFIRTTLEDKLSPYDSSNMVKKSENGLLSNLKKAFGQDNIEIVETLEEETTTKHDTEHSKSKHVKPTNIWKLSKSLFKKVNDYKQRDYFLDYADGIIKFHGYGIINALSLNEVLVLEEVSPVTYEDVYYVKKFLGFGTRNHKNPQIYLWQQGVFDDIITNFKTKVKDCKFGVKDDYLLIMGEMSNIPIYNVQEIVSRVQNKGFSEIEVFNICRSYQNMFNPIEVRIICENYTNPELLKFLKNDDTVFVENNPSKRRNMIRNGGL